jgi:acetyl esterase/lipase
MITTVAGTLALLIAVGAAMGTDADAAPASQRLLLWPTGAPTGDGASETVEVALTLYRPAGAGPAPVIVVCPGGGYGMLCVEPEGHGIARWLAANGIAGAVLEYRLPRGRAEVPLLDAQRAIRRLRADAASLGVDPKRVGIVGFSAGGHLALSAGTLFDDGDPTAADPVARQPSRPDAVIGIYPVVSMGASGHAGSRQNLLGAAPSEALMRRFSAEVNVTKRTSPMFLAHAADDTVVPPDNSVRMAEALQAAGVTHEYLALPSGGHGLNGYQGPMWEAWQSASLAWLRRIGFLR